MLQKTIISSLFVTSLTCHFASAATSSTDNFNDNSLSGSQWTNTLLLNNLQASETNSRLEFTTTGPATGFTDNLYHLRATQQYSYTSDWSVQLDTYVSNIHADFGLSNWGASLGLTIGNSGDPSDTASISLSDYLLNAKTYEIDLQTDGREVANSSVEPARGTSFADLGAVKVQWDSANTTLELLYDGDGSVGGYNWTAAASYDLAGGDTQWKMDANDYFHVAISSQLDQTTNGGAISLNSGDIFADNFTAVPEPSSSALIMIGSLCLLRRQRKA